MHGALAVLLFVLHASAYRWDTQAFTYFGKRGQDGITYRRSGNNECRVCFAEDCLPFSPVECEYYIETNNILEKDDEVENADPNPQLKSTVDSMVFSVIERAKSEGVDECIPYISKYTDCTKENICLGCKICECDMLGRWNCTMQQTCRPELIHLEADYKTLITVIEALKKGPEAIRLKRSLFHSMRSLEDIDIATDINEIRNHEDDINMNQAQAFDTYAQNTNTFLENTQNLHADEETPRPNKDKEIIELIVNSVIHDALPDVYDASKLDFENNRLKRWIPKSNPNLNLNNIDTTTNSILKTTHPTEEEKNMFKNKITFEELSEWVHEMHPLTNEKDSNQTAQSEENNMYETTTPKINLDSTATTMPEDTMTMSNAEYIAFEEVYNNMQMDNKTYVRRKPPLDHASKYTDKDFNMYDDKYYEIDSNTTTVDVTTGNHIVETLEQAITTENALIDDITEYYLQPLTEVVVDLFEEAKQFDLDNKTENRELTNNKIDDTDKLDPLNAVNIMKRDVSSSNKDQEKTNSTFTLNNSSTLESPSVNTTRSNATTTSSIIYLKDTVLDPLDTILENKQKEVREILRMREHLVKFIQAHEDSSSLNISSKDYPLRLYKLEYIPHHHHDLHNFRRTNFTVLDKYKLKLKRDVYEVIRDVVTMKKLYNGSTKFPADLNFLIKALKHYVHKTGFRPKVNIKNTRRNYFIDYNDNQYTIKSYIVKIFELLINNIRNTDALEPLSQHSRRLLKRFIKKNYVDDFAGTGLRIYDPHYNLTNDLRNVGTQWQILTSTIESSPITDKLHNMKRLHLRMSVDITKMNDALALIDFARGRRMIPVDESDGEEIVMNINKNLDKIKHKIQDVLSQKTIINLAQTDNLVSDENPKHKKKDSFMSQIKRLLSNSKKDILRLLGRKVPKSDIVKQIARKNVEEMTKKKLQDTMEKWQTNLNIIAARKKRSNQDYDKTKRRIKNIIPKYLRRKVPSNVAKSKKSKNKKKNTTIEHIKKKTSTSKIHKNGNLKLTTKRPALKNNKTKNLKKHKNTKHTTVQPTTIKYTTIKHTTTKPTTIKQTTIQTSTTLQPTVATLKYLQLVGP